MPFLAVDEDGTESIFQLEVNYDGVECETDTVYLPSGTIEKLIGRKLTWADDPVELTEDMVKKPETKQTNYEGLG